MKFGSEVADLIVEYNILKIRELHGTLLILQLYKENQQKEFIVLIFTIKTLVLQLGEIILNLRKIYPTRFSQQMVVKIGKW